jgi:hypothetical protein
MRLVICALSIALVACSKSPSAPSGSDSSGMAAGQAISALDGAGASGVSVQVGTRRATTDASGMFQVDVGSAGTYNAVLRGSAFVERETTVSVPGSSSSRLSLIPTSFDLVAFDEMFRTSHSQLQRWTKRPALVILATVMTYRGVDDEYAATTEQLSDDEVAVMVEHMTEGLNLLTGGTFSSFASVEIERPAAGDRVRVERDSKIVVGRYNGIVNWARTIGYGSWAEQPDGSITGGAMFLDRDFDRNETRRRLLRIHELGHALGYQHVTSRTSIMNPSIGPEPTDFDRTSALVAFQRSPGNKSPDIDPSFSSRIFATTGGPASWNTIFCR